MRGLRDLEDHIADRESGPGSNEAPVEAGDREVLSGGAAVDWMASGPENVDDFQGEKTYGPIGPAVVPQIPLTISFKAIRSDTNRMNDTQFWHTSV